MADDVSSFSDTIILLQRQINLIEQFSNGVELDINIDKTKIIVFRNGGNLKRTERWLYDNRNIEVVSYYKYLGVYLTSSLSWSKTHYMLSLQATKAMYQILKLRKESGLIEIKDLFKIFDATVKPILCYRSNIWGYHFVEKIERFKSHFAKRFAFFLLRVIV